MNKLNIVAIDFVFTTLEITSLVLVSGAMFDIHRETQIIQLKSIPLQLQKDSNTAV